MRDRARRRVGLDDAPLVAVASKTRLCRRVQRRRRHAAGVVDGVGPGVGGVALIGRHLARGRVAEAAAHRIRDRIQPVRARRDAVGRRSTTAAPVSVRCVLCSLADL
jgi:hypothetical protein